MGRCAFSFTFGMADKSSRVACFPTGNKRAAAATEIRVKILNNRVGPPSILNTK